MKVRAEMLKEGWILTQPVHANTEIPIVEMGKVLTKEDINFIQAFLIKEVEVDPDLDQKDSSNNNKNKGLVASVEFSKIYQKAMKLYRTHFISWESGGALNIVEFRKILIPLIEYVLNTTIKKIPKPKVTFKDDKDKAIHHSLLCTMFATLITQKLDYSKGDIIQIGVSAALCNAGFAKYHFKSIDQLESNPDYKNHPMLSYRMVEKVQFLRDQMKIAILQHEERLDGSGFPLKLKATHINEYASILGASAYYFNKVLFSKEYLNDFQIIEHINKECFGHFHPSVIESINHIVINYQLGDKVLLSNGVIGQIVYRSPNDITRPFVKTEHNDAVIDLAKDRKVYIQEVLY
jgi:HD-GYP domain-containing protein (c-di-GMP phosphodiesterase class II)